MKEAAIKFYEDILTNKNRNGALPHYDYRDFAEISLIWLGKKHPCGIRWRKPGVSYKARFMANGIYANKMYLFQQHMDYDRDTMSALRRFVQ